MSLPFSTVKNLRFCTSPRLLFPQLWTDFWELKTGQCRFKSRQKFSVSAVLCSWQMRNQRADGAFCQPAGGLVPRARAGTPVPASRKLPARLVSGPCGFTEGLGAVHRAHSEVPGKHRLPKNSGQGDQLIVEGRWTRAASRSEGGLLLCCSWHVLASQPHVLRPGWFVCLLPSGGVGGKSQEAVGT